jgi:hypothetical protein
VLHVFDSDGVDLGIYAGRQSGGGDNNGPVHGIIVWIYLPDPGVSLKVHSDTGLHVTERSDFYFTESSCKGTAYAQYAGMLMQPWENGSNGEFVITSPGSVTVSVRSKSTSTNGATSCYEENVPNERRLSRAGTVDPETELGLLFPLPAPLYVGLPLQ